MKTSSLALLLAYLFRFMGYGLFVAGGVWLIHPVVVIAACIMGHICVQLSNDLAVMSFFTR